MKRPRFLPLAPRPFDDELLSCWQQRVACRYGRSVLELERWLGPDAGHSWTGDFEQRDFSPDEAVIAIWARACRLPARRLAEMALLGRSRPLAWYVAAQPDRAVCPACLDEDAASGQDHYLRCGWAHIEAFVCSRHRQRLQDFCERCFSRSGFEFHGLAGNARLVCMTCSTVVTSRQADRAEPEKLEFLVTLADAVTSIVSVEAKNGQKRDEIMRAAQLLWTSSRTDDRPFIAWSGFSLPTGRQGMPLERAAPLATASLDWRIATLIGVAQLLNLADARRRFGPPSTFLLKAFTAEQDQERQPKSKFAVRPSGVAETPMTKLNLRSDAQYRALAEAILASPDWRKLQGAGDTASRRLLGRLMIQALDQAPPVQAGVPGRAAP